MANEASNSQKLVALSASRVKTFENCSWMYWCNYHLKLPQVQNDGAKKGEICHSIFEFLLKPKHKEHFTVITKVGSITGSKAVERLVRVYLDKKDLSTNTDNFLMIDSMIMVGLKNDFFIKAGKLVAPEYEFDLTNEVPRYRVKGLMDKPFIRKNEIIIDDFKSSKQKFEGEELESNVQAMVYSLVATKLWPKLTPTVRFIFLQFPDDPIMEVKFKKDALKGFENYLEYAQNQINNFDINKAKTHFAADEIPPKGEFKGNLLCGRAQKPGQLKKDGTKMWHCPYKFGFDYYVIKDDKGNIVSTYFEGQLDKIKLKPNQTIDKLHYDGCPKFRNSLGDFPDTPISRPVAYKNVLDDF